MVDQPTHELIAWMSHELRQPIASLECLLDRLSTDEEGLSEILAAVQVQIQDLNRIFQDIQEIHAVGSIPPDPVDKSVYIAEKDRGGAFDLAFVEPPIEPDYQG